MCADIYRTFFTLEPDNSNDDGEFLEQVSVGLENMMVCKKKAYGVSHRRRPIA